MSDDRPAEQARFVARENRFVVRARLADGRVVRAYLPNTARLTELLVPEAELVLVAADVPHRRTGWTVTRVWDATWVALEASRASALVAEHLEAGGALPGWPQPVAVRREVTRADHRFDLAVELPDDRTGLVEVKSVTRAHDRVAPLSGTPSQRGVAQLATLGELAGTGIPTAVVFVVQRGDVDVVDLGRPADPTWVHAVRAAREHGVTVAAYACEVDTHDLRLDRLLPVRDTGGD